MKKKIVLLLAVVLPFVFIGCSERNFNEQKFLGVNGRPKSVKDTKYEAIEKFGEVIEQDITEVINYEFDKFGHVQKVSVYNEDGEIVYSEINKFEDSKCIESKSYLKYYTTTSTIKNRTANNEIWESKTSDGKTTTLYHEYVNLIKIVIIKDSDGNILSKSEIEIDNNGNIIEYKVYDDSETLYYCYKSTFDNKSQEIERKILGGYNEGLYTYKYDSFDSKGNWTKKIEYKDGEIESLEIRKIEY